MDNLQDMFKRIRKFGLEFIGLYYSSYPGIVASNLDPLGQNRLFIIVPGIFGYPSKPMWFYPKGSSPLIHNLPQVGEVVMVEFDNGRTTMGKWEFSAPLKGKKPVEFRSDKVYGFKSPTGHLVMIDEIDNLITIRHKDGQKITITETSTIITSEDIRLSTEEPEEKSPLGNKLDSDIKEALEKVADLLGVINTYASTQSAASVGPLEVLEPGYSTLNSKVLLIKQELSQIINKFEDESHLSEKVRLS